MNRDITSYRENYSLNSLDKGDVSEHAVEQFIKWFDEACDSQVLEPNAMILSTTDQLGHADARTVLLKNVDHNGFSFFTNYQSQKAVQIEKIWQGHLLFLWLPLQRQVRIKGTMTKLSHAENEAYFHSRPRESQIGAWASPQSSVIKDRAYLENRFKDFSAKLENEEIIPLPDYWGGYLLEPTSIEFWQGRESRLHDRLLYTKVDGKWKIERLAP